MRFAEFVAGLTAMFIGVVLLLWLLVVIGICIFSALER
jgi:hypothetical protein